MNQGQAKAGILFLYRGAKNSLAVSAQSVLYSPVGAVLSLVASNSNPAVSFSDTLPGLANYYTGANPQTWVTGVPRYGTVTLAGLYPGVDAQYTSGANGVLTLNLFLAAGVNVQSLQFAMAQVVSLTTGSNGSLTAQLLGNPPERAAITYPPPIASQGSGAGEVNLVANFAVQSATSFGVTVQGVDTTEPLEISIPLSGNAVYQAAPFESGTTVQQAADSAGNNYYAIAIAEAAGSSAPFPSISGVGCGSPLGEPIACSDVAVYKYSATGALQFVTYLSGQNSETAGFVGVAASGTALVVAGTTDSANFPVTASTAQQAYAGPPAAPEDSDGLDGGDFFAAVLDPALGHLQAATFLGGPNADTMGRAALGADGSLYFLPVYSGSFSADMPVSTGALQSACQSNPCQNGYVAHLSPGLDKLLYGTYLPGIAQATAQLYSDGSVYYAGTAQAGFPATPNAYQTQNAGGYDGIMGRLDPTGAKLIFGTYFGGPNTNWIYPIAVGPDGSVWAGVSSFIACCINVQPQLIHLDASGSKLLADLPISPYDMIVDNAGDLYALVEGPISVSPDALLGGSCGGAAYVELNSAGQQLFATYLLVPVSGFVGADAQGTPYLGTSSGAIQVVPSQPSSTAPYAGCLVDSALFGVEQAVSPGEIVTIFGSGLGPSPGVGFQLVSAQAPTSLGGTQVLVNGEPAPLVYASYGQVNLILPYSLTVGTEPSIQVVSNGTPANALSNLQVQAAGITIFQVNNAAAALNQDGTINSAQNPAHPGSTVVLFGIGGGQTSPASVAGEVTPLGLRPLTATTQVQVPYTNSAPSSPEVTLTIEYAGAAPELLSGVTQMNVTLPEVIPATPFYPPGVLPLVVLTNGQWFGYQTVTIFVAAN